jgi:hypothetical protein
MADIVEEISVYNVLFRYKTYLNVIKTDFNYFISI